MKNTSASPSEHTLFAESYPCPPSFRLKFRLPLLAGVAFLLSGASSQAALILDYEFSEGSGTTVADSSGFGTAANGTLTGAAGWSSSTASGSGYSLSLPASPTQGAELTSNTSLGGPTSSKISGLSQVTVVAWVNLADVANGDRLISARSTDNTGFEWILATPVGAGAGLISASNFALILQTNTVQTTSTVNVTTSGWIFLAATYDGTVASNNVNFYLGTQTGSVTQLGTTSSSAAGSMLNATGNFYIGDTSATTADRTPGGLFDSVKVYNSAESISSLEAIRLASVPEPSTAMLAMLAGGLGVLRFRKKIRAL